MSRIGKCVRNTSETQIEVSINLDGTGKSDINTGIGFFDHMLISFAKHGLFDLNVKDKKSIKRYGYMILPMDECLTMCALDLSGRPYLVFNAEFTTDSVGGFDTEMVKEFFHAITYSTGMNLHIKMLEPGNNHHMIEGIYKAFAKALDQATIKDERITDVLSTKGTL